MDFFNIFYPWIKSFHLIAVIAWMAGLFYLPRLYVYHSEKASVGSEFSESLKVMEGKLYRLIMTPSMIVTWILGLMLVGIPGVVDWGSAWFYVKFLSVLTMTWFHVWLGLRRKDFIADQNETTGRTYRLMNEVPTVLLIIIVIMVIVKPI